MTERVVLGVLALALIGGLWIAARLVIRSIGGALDRRQVRGNALVAIRRVVYVLFVGVAVLIAFAWASNSANAVLAGLILATLVASLGIQDLMKNYVSGFYILLEKHVQPGDRIRFESAEGVVSDIRLRVTLLRGESGAQVVVPNAELFNKTVIVSKNAAVAPRRKRLADRAEQDSAEGVEPVSG